MKAATGVSRPARAPAPPLQEIDSLKRAHLLALGMLAAFDRLRPTATCAACAPCCRPSPRCTGSTSRWKNCSSIRLHAAAC
jgi:hypothetical protein